MKIKAIIPCAGFGTRMGMAPDQSKEMLPDKANGYDHIIDFALDLCKIHDLEPVVITRKEKKDLKAYLMEKNIQTVDIEVNQYQEWQHTVHKSRVFWNEYNILILPDTRFPKEIIKDIKKGFELGNKAVIAVHGVPAIESSKWGIIMNYAIHEKPSLEFFPHGLYAWGLIGFESRYGEEIFKQVHGHQLKDTGFCYLDYFVDITRGNQ